MDHKVSPEKFLTHLSARVTFQLGYQPLDIAIYLTWRYRRLSLLQCSLTGTASNIYDRVPQVYKMTGLLENFQKTIAFSQKHAYHAQLEALSLVKKDSENVPHAKLDTFVALLNHPFIFILLSIWLTPKLLLLKKTKTPELSPEVNALSDTLQQNASIEEPSSESLQIE